MGRSNPPLVAWPEITGRFIGVEHGLKSDCQAMLVLTRMARIVRITRILYKEIRKGGSQEIFKPDYREFRCSTVIPQIETDKHRC
jgi:hypothetical protein